MEGRRKRKCEGGRKVERNRQILGEKGKYEEGREIERIRQKLGRERERTDEGNAGH